MAEAFSSNPNMTPVSTGYQQPQQTVAHATETPVVENTQGATTVDMTNVGETATPEVQQVVEEKETKHLNIDYDYKLPVSYIDKYLSFLNNDKNAGDIQDENSETTRNLNSFMSASHDDQVKSFRNQLTYQNTLDRNFSNANNIIKKELAINTNEKSSNYTTEDGLYKFMVTPLGILRQTRGEDGIYGTPVLVG